MHITNEALKVNLEQQQNNNARAKFENRYLEEDLICDQDTVTNDANILILSSYDFESANKRSNMGYLSDLTMESFTRVEV